MLIRNGKTNISVSAINGYTKEKVIAAKRFIDSSTRQTPIQQWLDMYNYLRGTNEKILGCSQCASVKYINGVKNYAKYGELVLSNQGISLEEEETPKVEEEVIDEPIPSTKESTQEEEPKKKGRKKKNV